MATQTQAKGSGQASSLVLALHGAYLFNIWPNIIEVVIPRVSGHMYMIEEGLPGEPHEMQGQRRFGLIDGGTFALSGVEDNDTLNSPDPTKTVEIAGHESVSSGPDVFCRLLLPLPNTIATARNHESCDPSVPVFLGDSSSEILSTRFPSCIILVYTTITGQLTFGMLPWNPEPDHNGVVHLRIYAESIETTAECSGPLNHIRHAFDCLVSLLPDFDASINPAATFRNSQSSTVPEQANRIDLQGIRQRLNLDPFGAEFNPPADCGPIINTALTSNLERRKNRPQHA